MYTICTESELLIVSLETYANPKPKSSPNLNDATEPLQIVSNLLQICVVRV